MNTESFAFALAIFFLYWLGEGIGILFAQAYEYIESRRLCNKILKKSLKGG